MVDLKDELLFTFGGINNISKELLFDWFDIKYKSLLESIEATSNEFKKVFQDQEDKISSLINEREKYKDLYYQTRDELDRLKNQNISHRTLQNLSTRLKKAHEQLDKLERDKKELEVQLYDMTKMRDNWKSDYDYQYECFCAERERRQELEK